MAEFNYLGTWNDSFRILEDLLRYPGIRAYVDQPYANEHPPSFTVLTDEIKEQLRRWDRVFLFGDYSTYPPLLHPRENGPQAGMFFLSPIRGGPHLGFDLAKEQMLDGKLTLFPGGLQSQPWYMVEPDHFEDATPELRTAYFDLQKVMKRHLTRYKESAWMGKEALRRFESGEVHGRPFVLDNIAKYDAKQKAKLSQAIENVRAGISRKNTKKTAAARTSRPPR